MLQVTKLKLHIVSSGHDADIVLLFTFSVLAGSYILPSFHNEGKLGNSNSTIKLNDLHVYRIYLMPKEYFYL